MSLICNENTFKRLSEYTSSCIDFVNEYKWVTDAYVSDFFFKHHWERLPKNWRHCLHDWTTEDLTILLDKDKTTTRNVPPLSLLAFKVCAETYSLDRQCVENVKSIFTQLFEENDTYGADNEGMEKTFKRTNDDELHAFFKKHVKPKKRHEIQNLSKVIDLLGQRLCCRCVIDVGSGLGHLSRLLSFRYGMKVIDLLGQRLSCRCVIDIGSGLGHLSRLLSFRFGMKVVSVEASSAHADQRLFIFLIQVINLLGQRLNCRCVIDVGSGLGHLSRLLSIKYRMKVIDLLGQKLCCRCVIDVGSGLGHLSRLLSFRYGMKVVSIEAASTHAPKASKFDKEVEKEVKKKKEKGEISDQFQSETGALPCHVTRLIHPHTTIDEFIDVIKENQSRNYTDQLDNCDKMNSSPNKLNAGNNQNKKMKFTNDNFVPNTDRIENKCPNILKCENTHSMNNVDNHTNNSKESDKFCENNEMLQEQENISENVNTSSLNCDKVNSSNCSRNDNQGEIMDKFILTGLHACGDLTATFLRFFVNCPEAAGLASVGCCYMKLSDESSKQETVGYPLSDSVKGISNHQLSYAARELACHFADAYCQRLKDNPPHLRIHSYRAALEWLANKMCPTFQRSAVQIPAKKTNKLDFEGYVKLGLEKLGMDYNDVTESMMQTATEMTHRWKDVVAFYTIRLALAPVMETIVLLDRMMFLFENGYESAIVPIFDPSLSPRNFVLLAWKR